MICGVCQKIISDLKEENKVLNEKIKKLETKLADNYSRLNRFHRDSYESVDFGNGRDL